MALLTPYSAHNNAPSPSPTSNCVRRQVVLCSESVMVILLCYITLKCAYRTRILITQNTERYVREKGDMNTITSYKLDAKTTP